MKTRTEERRQIGALVVPPTIAETIEPWQAHLAGRKMRPRARQTYARELRAFATWLGDEPTIAAISPESLDRYQAALSDHAAATISKKLSAIRSYCRFLQKTKLRTDDPTADVEWPRRPRRLPRPLKASELTRLEEILSAPPPTLDVRARRILIRNRRIILLLLYGGLRRQEVAALVWADVDLDEGQLLVRSEGAKGGVERLVPLHPRLIANLSETPLEGQRGAVAGHPDGRCLSHKTIGHVFERSLREQGLHISAHRLRHTCATQLLRHGADVREVQTILGHQDLRTTAGYVDLLIDQQRRAINRLPERFD